jgi:hypothetical protein
MNHRLALATSTWALIAVGLFAACSSDTPAPTEPTRLDASSPGDAAPPSVDAAAPPSVDAAAPQRDAAEADSGVSGLRVFPSEVTVLVGGPPATFQVSLKVAGVPTSAADAQWVLEGPGTLSGSLGGAIEYTPPATLGSVTTAKLTVSHPSTTPVTSVITLKANTPMGNVYAIVGQIQNSAEGNTRVEIAVNSGGADFAGATVKVNGTTIPYAGGYRSVLGARLMPREPVALSIMVPEGEIRGSTSMPEAAVVTAPTASAVVPAGNLLVTWTTPLQPDLFRGGLGLDPYDANFAPFFNTLATDRSTTIAGLPAGKNARVYLVALNKAQNFTGPVKADSTVSVEAFAPSSAVLFSSAR